MLVTQLCPTFCNPMDYSLPGFSVHGILQARILEWVTIPFSRESSWPRDQTQVSCIAGRLFLFMVWVTTKSLLVWWEHTPSLVAAAFWFKIMAGMKACRLSVGRPCQFLGESATQRDFMWHFLFLGHWPNF